MDQLTPMMEQYLGIKECYPDYILFYRMGDFYELFFKDATDHAQDLEVVLTKRGSHKGGPIPMCGVPVHALELYCQKLLSKGHSIAICEQIQTPEQAKKEGHKGPLKRDVTRIMTPGTITEESLLQQKTTNFLLCVGPRGEGDFLGLAFCDLSLGMFLTKRITYQDFINEVEMIKPVEVLACDTTDILNAITYHKRIPPIKFQDDGAKRRIEKFFSIKDVGVFGLSLEEIQSSGALIDYLKMTHNDRCHFQGIQSLTHKNHLKMDEGTRKSLELFEPSKGSVMGGIQATKTPMGQRHLKNRMLFPYINQDDINASLDRIEYFYAQPDLIKSIQNQLSHIGDMERLLCRLLSKRESPKDLYALFIFLTKCESLNRLNVMDYQQDLCHLKNRLSFIKPDLPARLSFDQDVIIFDHGFCAELDGKYQNFLNAQERIDHLEKQYSQTLSIPSLKIKNNHIVGTFIEVSKSYISKVPDTFVHRQTLSQGRRYITQELSEMVSDLSRAKSDYDQRQLILYDKLIDQICGFKEILFDMIHAVGELDLYTSLAYVALSMNYTRPIIVSDPILNITQGRHCSIEKTHHHFVPNDCHMNDDHHFFLLTGPNMAGKSTYLRGNALIVLLAHMGCFVPAQSAVVGVCDQIFTRIGASDDLSKGRSTFMVEMIETSRILNQSTHQSFVILDEIGRGTSTYDGVAIAWAVSEFLHDLKCRTLFATHYQELTVLEKKCPGVQCYHVQVLESNQDLLFLHKVVPGASSSSYGIQVAALSGFPKHVVTRARDILFKLSIDQQLTQDKKQKTLFDA
jgi:DNA mismatch repair protein MutS